MRVWAVGLLAALASTAVTGRADAAGRLLVPAGSSASLGRVRVALATAPGRTTAWLSMTLGGETPRAAWVIPVEPGTLADRASSRWLSALDDATAPRIFPPASATGPGCTLPGLFESTAEPQSTADGLAVTAAETLSSLGELEAYALSHQLVLGPEDQQVLRAHGERFLGLLFEAPRPGVWSEPVRISYPVSHSSVALDLLGGSSTVSLSLLLLGDQGLAASGLLEVPAERLMITWSAPDGRSDYPSVRAATLGLHQGGVALNEYSASAALFDWTLLPDGAGFVAPAPVTYFEREGVGALGCATALGDFAEQTARASVPCPPGALARVPMGDGSDPGCLEPDPGSSFDARRLGCGGADEVVYALGGLGPDAVLTRLELLVAESTPAELELLPAATLERGCAIRASGLIGADCAPIVRGTGGTSSGGAPVGQRGTGGTEPTFETDDDSESPADVAVDASCSSSPNGCDGGSDQSSASEGCCASSDDGYSGDSCCSSSSDGYSGDTCGSSSGGDGCGSSGGGYSGDTCSGGGGECSLKRARRHRARLSSWVMFAAMVLGPLRRWGRRRARATVRSRVACSD